jgi:hypothetical protein
MWLCGLYHLLPLPPRRAKAVIDASHFVSSAI